MVEVIDLLSEGLQPLLILLNKNQNRHLGGGQDQRSVQVQSVNAYASLTGADGASGQNAPAAREAVRRSKPVKKSPGVKSGRPRNRF